MRMTSSIKGFKFPAKAKATLYLLTTTGLTISAANQLYSPSFPDNITAVIHGVLRSSRAFATIALSVADYKYSLWRLPVDSDDYQHQLSEVHFRSAKRIMKLCEANKGFYVKAGQFVATMRQVPNEYSSTLSSLQDQAVPCHFKAIKEVLIGNLGDDLSKIFISFDEKPIAAASIAQVHHAVLKNHEEVAVKVQYPGLERQMTIDRSTMSFLSKSVEWLFPEYRFAWLVPEFANTISLELDFIQEARNAERTSKNFENNDVVMVPRVFWGLTTNKVLTMQFCSGHKVDNVDFLKEIGVNPTEVAKSLIEVFAEMIFINGFVHGDPHPGNILVCPKGPKGFSLVLLDHGVYKQLDEGFRQDYCQLWKALILLDSQKIQQLAERFGVGKYSRYFPVIFTGRTIDSKSILGRGMSANEKRSLKQELKSLKLEDISSFMESLPPDFLTILRIDGLLRSVLTKLGAPQRVRLLVYVKHAVYGLSPKLKVDSDSAIRVLFHKFMTSGSYLQLRIVLGALELLHCLEKVKQFFKAFCRKISGTTMII
ncbi:hypothetical protein K2173_019828 [Erythroxylum novogranatense]|uniref:ABC1 atypical kinase-like domain-containing protein n=1 Tax=Erythroxylum novogranatense TaxID=1862640 RepID=A0AAV8SN72_9ROSI|nr:hypothetical protein K2173_019828 [Erythroxylum novogranatense]